jgi:ankyrin repeat protein
LSDAVANFIEAACPPHAGHASGSLDEAEAIRTAHPDVTTQDIHSAAIFGDADAVRRWLDADRANATAKGGPRGWDALTYLCFSRYLRLDRAQSDGFVRAAAALLDAGARANTGFWESDHQPRPEWESAIYGAAGVAHHAAITRLLLERGANPNDEETPYHTPETYDNDALKALVESGTLTADSLATMLLRKSDWHDYDGLTYLLEHGADPNRMTRWRLTGFHQAIRRDNHLRNIEALLDHGADATLTNGDGRSGISLAARRGRSDVLASLDRRGVRQEFDGIEHLIAACAANDTAAMRAMTVREPRLVRELQAEGGTLLSQFAGNANTDGVRHLLDLGVDVAALYQEGDGYFGIATNSTALHVAAWRASHDTVRFLISRNAPVNVVDDRGRTPLALAVRACVDSYWASRRSPESVKALLDAGASTAGVSVPTGYADIDVLLRC